jgi:hypothetical protein
MLQEGRGRRREVRRGVAEGPQRRKRQPGLKGYRTSLPAL